MTSTLKLRHLHLPTESTRPRLSAKTPVEWCGHRACGPRARSSPRSSARASSTRMSSSAENGHAPTVLQEPLSSKGAGTSSKKESAVKPLFPQAPS
eukprot:9489809-Pyramimonas_sp.AAC.1